MVIVRSTLVCDGERRALALTEKEEEISLVPMASFQQRGPALGTHISASHGWGQLDSTCVRSCVRVKIWIAIQVKRSDDPAGGEPSGAEASAAYVPDGEASGSREGRRLGGAGTVG